VGAHVGYYTRRLSRRVGPKGRVIALEPHSPTFRLLARNVPATRFANVDLLPVAAGEAAGELPIIEFTGSGKHSFYDVSAFDSDYRPLGTEETVTVARLDDLLHEHGVPAVQFLKLDIEGAELAALRGMSLTLAASPAVAAIVEYNARAVRAASGTATGFVSEMRGHGFDLLMLRESGSLEALPADPEDLPGENYVNLLAVKGMAARDALADPLAFRNMAMSAGGPA
jgi:FkbM family methyltransferase